MPIPVIVSTNYKGGVGKTTTSRVLAQAMAEDASFNHGKPVLVIDLDPQGNTSRRWQLLQTLHDGSRIPKPHPALADEQPGYSSVCDLWLGLLGMGNSLAPEPYPTSNPLIHVVPTHEDLMNEAMLVPKADRHKLGHIMRGWLRDDGAEPGNRLSDKYCCVIIDTQPSKTPLIDAALQAATHCYIPFIPEPQAVEGVYSIISYVHSLSSQRGSDVPLELLGLLPNMVQSTRLHNLHLKKLRTHHVFGNYLMPVKLSRRIGYSETDDWRNTPEQVTDLGGTAIEFEARKFSRYVMGKISSGQLVTDNNARREVNNV
ncbi:ParA family protein [Stutzerimonas stutzeri]|uniref:ParA family protein n=1 Tax=Stutzerimonas stutzeri TaxID=316 RepID=UPI0015E34543|nr:ParA family protein [Stutzerimonas stutzeri]MBA1280296.1 ParA family protein [Stutzerimonas stutzeri]